MVCRTRTRRKSTTRPRYPTKRAGVAGEKIRPRRSKCVLFRRDGPCRMEGPCTWIQVLTWTPPAVFGETSQVDGAKNWAPQEVVGFHHWGQGAVIRPPQKGELPRAGNVSLRGGQQKNPYPGPQTRGLLLEVHPAPKPAPFGRMGHPEGTPSLRAWRDSQQSRCVFHLHGYSNSRRTRDGRVSGQVCP